MLIPGILPLTQKGSGFLFGVLCLQLRLPGIQLHVGRGFAFVAGL